MKNYILFIMLMLASFGAFAASCNQDGKYSWTTCYGLEHGVIAGAIVGGTAYVAPEFTLPVAVGTCGAFIYRELQGQGGLFKDADRFFDWAVPCAIGAGITYKWGDQSWIPYYDGEESGVMYHTTID